MERQQADDDIESGLVRMCIESATKNSDAVEIWRRQCRTLERMPMQLGEALLRRLLRRRLLYPSLLEVFQYCIGSIDLRGENLVDGEWMAYLGAFRYLHSINVADCRGINNSALWALTGMDSLKVVDISRCSKVNDAGIVHLLSIPKLEKICISETGLTENGIIQLSSLRQLSVLDLGGLPVTDLALGHLQVLTNLEYLDLWGSKISNNGVAVLKMFPKLNFLNVAWTNVTKVPSLPSLACLNMSNCTVHSIFEEKDDGEEAPPHLQKLLISGATFTDIREALFYIEPHHLSFLDVSNSSLLDLGFLVDITALEHFDLSFNRIGDDSIGSILLLGATLRFLNMSNTRITSAGLGILVGNVPNIETLLLSHTAIDDSALPYVSMMDSLKVVDLSHTNVKGYNLLAGKKPYKVFSLATLQNLNHLERLNLEETQVRDEALQPLSGLLQLKELSLKSDFLTDITLLVSSSFKKLKFLGIRGAVLTDNGLCSFKPPPLLGILDLRDCWLLTSNTILSFCHCYPHIELKHEHSQRLAKQQEALGHLTAATGTSRTLQLRPKRGKMSLSPYSLQRESFVDERLKYTRQELMELQFSSFSQISLSGNNVLASETLLE